MITTREASAQILARARGQIGRSQYRRCALLTDAPAIFNCFRFTQWLWLQAGIRLPDHQLVWSGAIKIPVSEAQAADLVFVPRLDYTLVTDDFGHVGILTERHTVIHATKWRNGVVEDPASEFLARGCLGIRRIKNCRPP